MNDLNHSRFRQPIIFAAIPVTSPRRRSLCTPGWSSPGRQSGRSGWPRLPAGPVPPHTAPGKTGKALGLPLSSLTADRSRRRSEASLGAAPSGSDTTRRSRFLGARRSNLRPRRSLVQYGSSLVFPRSRSARLAGTPRASSAGPPTARPWGRSGHWSRESVAQTVPDTGLHSPGVGTGPGCASPQTYRSWR